MRTLRRTAARREYEENAKRARPSHEDSCLCPFKYTAEISDVVMNVLHKSRIDKVVCNVDGIALYGRDLHTLKRTEWVNDSIVDAYLKLVVLRAKENAGKYPRVHCFTSFFYPRLQAGGYEKVQRWTANVDIFANDLLFVPIHYRDHWSILCVDLRDHSFTYYDSRHVDADDYVEAPPGMLKLINNYLIKEAEEKQKPAFRKVACCRTLNYPHQLNEVDCGIYMLTYAEFRSIDREPIFEQKMVPKLRRRMVFELASGRLDRDTDNSETGSVDSR